MYRTLICAAVFVAVGVYVYLCVTTYNKSVVRAEAYYAQEQHQDYYPPAE